MLIVHHLGISQSDRIVWLCEELGLDYELKRYDRDPQTRMAPADYKALHPFGTAPVIEDDGLKLAESGAIVEYLIHKHGGGRLALTPDHPDYADYLHWFHFANASLAPAAMVDLVLGMIGIPPGTPADALRTRLDTAYAMIDARLGETDYLGGNEFTAADIMTLFPLTTMRMFADRDMTPYPNLRAYLKRIGDRPALQRAMAKADPGLPLKID